MQLQNCWVGSQVVQCLLCCATVKSFGGNYGLAVNKHRGSKALVWFWGIMQRYLSVFIWRSSGSVVRWSVLPFVMKARSVPAHPVKIWFDWSSCIHAAVLLMSESENVLFFCLYEGETEKLGVWACICKFVCLCTVWHQLGGPHGW